jgi:hypothetical protein
MGMAGQKTYNSPNPLNYNYPKMEHIKGDQYKGYPKFKEKASISEKDQKLANELEASVKLLKNLTKQATDLAKQVIKLFKT